MLDYFDETPIQRKKLRSEFKLTIPYRIRRKHKLDQGDSILIDLLKINAEILNKPSSFVAKITTTNTVIIPIDKRKMLGLEKGQMIKFCVKAKVL